MVSELGKDTKIPDLRSLSAFVGNLLERREGSDGDEAGRDRRELRQTQGEGGVTHDLQDQANARRTERDECTDEG